MLKFDEFTGRNTQKHNPQSPQIPDHLQRILIVGGFEQGKTNKLLNNTHREKLCFIQFSKIMAGGCF